jgi:WD40 repeat protein
VSGRESPFKGLESFEDSDHDARLFFGREREREIIVANLLASKLTVLYGDTGVGKSSVLRAGVARDLRALPEPLAVVVFDEWKDDPAGTVQERVAASTGAERQSRLVDTLELGAAMVGGEVVVILDGFEEEFLYHGLDAGPDSFFDQFSEAVTRPGLRASFLVAVREDALAKLDRFKSRVPNVFGNYLRLPHLDRDAAREAIVGPVDRYNETSDTPIEVEPALVEAVLDQVAAGKVELGQAGRGGIDADGSQAGIEAPYLQLVMERLWEAESQAGSNVVRLETFERLGGAEQIVRDHLDRALAALDPAQRDVAAVAFNHLVTPSGAKIAHDASDLAGYVGVPESDVAPVLSSLAAQRILRSVPGVRGSEQPRYEIYHDILADPVLAWRTRHESERELERVHDAAAKRHRRLLLVAAGAVVLAGAMALATIYAFAKQSEADAEKQKAHARAFEASALTQLTADPVLSLLLAVEAVKLDSGAQAQAVLRSAILASRERGIFHTRGPTVAAHFSPDGSRVLVAGGAKAKVYDTRSRRKLLTLDHGAPITAAGYSPNGDVIFTAGDDGKVRLWAASNGHLLQVLRNGAKVRTAQFDPKGARIAASGGGVVNVWRVRDGHTLFTHRFDWPVTTVRLSSGGTLLAVAGNNRSALVFDLAARKRPHEFNQGDFVKDIAFSPDDRLLATGGRTGGAVVWDVRTGAKRQTLPHKTEVLTIAFSPDGTALGTAGADGVGRIWNVSNGRLRVALIGHTHKVLGIAFSSDGQYVVTSSSDGTGRVWSIAGDLQTLLAGDSDSVTQASFSRDGRQVLTASDDGTARIWDPDVKPRLHTLAKEKGPLRQLIYLGRGRMLTAGPGDEALLLRASDGSLLRRFRVDGDVAAVGADAHGKRIAVAAGKTTTLFDAATGRRLRILRQGSNVDSVALSPHGDLLATGGADAVGRLWNLADLKKKPQRLTGHTKAIVRIVFSHHGSRLATASQDHTAQIWNVSGRRLHKFAQDSNAVTSVDFGPHDGKLLTSSADADARVWDTQRGARQQLLRWHLGAIADAAFSPDGHWVATAGPTTIQLWQPQVRGSLFPRPLFPLGVGGPGGITGVAFDSSSHRVLAVTRGGEVLAFRCDICRGADELLQLATARLARTGRTTLTKDEKKLYGG